MPLLYEGAPELRDILRLFDVTIEMPEMALDTHELRARFQSLVEGVFTVLAETRLFALFLDDLQEASESSVDLITTLANSRSRMVCLWISVLGMFSDFFVADVRDCPDRQAVSGFAFSIIRFRSL